MKTRVDRAAKALGGRGPLGTVYMAVFVPSVDRRGRALRGPSWVGPTLRLLGRLFRGATAYPRARGVWRDDDAGGRLVFDETTLVFSYVAEQDLSRAALRDLRRFLHRMGREARQGEVGVVLDGRYLRIADFDEGWN